MARKYDLISELYRRTCQTVVGNPQNWEAFLRCACHNYRLRFDEQLLLYAQRPDATAVLEIERWNTIFGRWVNRGARGIAVFEDADRSVQRLTHYFDISDTHESRYSRPVPIWQMKPEYTEAVIDTLENTFGTLNDKTSLADAVMSAAQNAVEDNIPDYVSDLIYCAGDSFLYGLDEDMIAAMYKSLVTNSVAYMMSARLGMDTDLYFEAADFSNATNFNTQETLNALGFATSDIAEMGLSEISRTILALDRQNRIIAEKGKTDYNKSEAETERSAENERNQIHNAGRLQPAESGNAQTAGGNDGQIRSDETEVPERTSPNPVLQSADKLHSDEPLGGNRADGIDDGRNSDEADGAEGGLDREPESDRYDEVGAGNEQSEEQSAGDREGGGNLRLGYYDRSHEDKSLPSFGKDEDINEMLSITPHLKATKEEIRAFYENTSDNAARTEYIKSIFNDDYTELILSDGRRVGYKTYENVLHLWEGSYLSRTAQSYYDWGVIARHFEALRLLGQLRDTMKPLPSVDGQMTFLDMQAEEKTSAFTFSQEIIDAVLTRGSGVSEGKFRIYEQFEKSLSAKENIDFLKNEYGWGGVYPVITGTGINEQHDGKGILLSRGIGDDKPHILLKWNQVEKRLAELIRLDRYLNPKEKELYPEWQRKQEERRAELAEEQKNKEILSSAPPERKQEERTEQNAEYEYHLGDTVYMGADEYEIFSFDDERVKLRDMQYPLFTKEMERAEFDRKVRENPMNDHLKVKELPSERGIAFDPNTTPIGDDDYYFHRPGMGGFEAIYYNPDSNAGGQFVVLHLPYELIAEAQANSNTIDGFYEYLDSAAYTELIDVGTQEFSDYLEAYAEPNPDYIGRTRETMQALVEQAEKALNNGNKDIPYSETKLDEAKRIIDEYCREEFEREEGADYTDLSNVEVAYTTTEDEKHEIQARVNLVDFRIEALVDGKAIRSEQFSTLEDMVERGLQSLSFDELVYLSDEELAKVENISAEQPAPEPEKPLTPAFTQEKRSRVQTFDLHPEIPMSERHTFDLASHEVPEAGKKERFRRNIMAIQLLKKCQEENRFATPEEQEILSQYVGWGGIPEAFDENNSSWATEYLELKSVLTPDEYISARESTLTAFYTPPTVISAIYKAMGQMGFREGNILEPSCGIGNFIGMLPETMQNAKMYGVEIDTVSAGIAQ